MMTARQVIIVAGYLVWYFVIVCSMLMLLPVFLIYDVLANLMYYICCRRARIAKWSVRATIIVLAAPFCYSCMLFIPTLINLGWAGAALSPLPRRVVSFEHSDTIVGNLYCTGMLMFYLLRTLCRLLSFVLVGCANMPIIVMFMAVMAQCL